MDTILPKQSKCRLKSESAKSVESAKSTKSAESAEFFFIEKESGRTPFFTEHFQWLLLYCL